MTVPVIQVRYSDDGGRNFTNWREISLGDLGEYQTRQRIRRLGATRNRVWEIQCAEPVKVNLLGAVAFAELTDG